MALDRYERICNQCIDLRQRSLAGESVSASSITDLLGQLASLRNSLQEAAGRMTPSQRARFESIRLRYAEAFSGSDPVVPSARLSLQPPLASPSRLPSLSPSSLTIPGPSLLTSGIMVPNPDPGHMTDQPRNPIRFGVVAFASLPALRPGLMTRLDFGRAGLFLKGSFLPVSDPSYTCNSDGTTPTGFIWTTGEERVGVCSFSAGGTISMFTSSLNYNFSSGNIFSLRLYAGAGYGSRSVLWEDVDGKWALVSDLSFKGVSADAGFLFDIGHLTLLTGVSTVSFRSISFDFGIGVLF